MVDRFEEARWRLRNGENEENEEILGRSLKSIALFAGPFRVYG